jgi:hypothetical protein
MHVRNVKCLDLTPFAPRLLRFRSFAPFVDLVVAFGLIITATAMFYSEFNQL